MGKLAKSIVPPPQVRARFVFGAIGAGVITAIALSFVLLSVAHEPVVEPTEVARPVSARCTPLEAKLYLKDAALTVEERATCLALAGFVDDARVLLRAMAVEQRNRAISTIFEIAHPIADAGDDRSAGPLMMLVVEIWPENYMAMFHAGMAQYALGKDDSARGYLERFLGMYAPLDVWHQRAVDALSVMAAHVHE
jgi:hypothetical protein